VAVLVPLSRSELSRIQERRAEVIGDVGYGLFRGTPWIGDAGERALALVLRSHGIPFVHHGGVDRLPDFEVAGRSVGVKTTTKRKLAIVPAPHIDHEWDWFVFAGWLERERAVELRGALRPATFRDRATHYRVGDEPWVKYECYGVPLAALVSFEAWVSSASQSLTRGSSVSATTLAGGNQPSGGSR
jgi:hypothetical protein